MAKNSAIFLHIGGESYSKLEPCCILHSRLYVHIAGRVYLVVLHLPFQPAIYLLQEEDALLTNMELNFLTNPTQL